MHSAPSVTYPVGRSRGATRILVFLWALGALCAGASCFLADTVGWRHLLIVLSVLFAGLAAGFGLRQDEAGTLHFDGLGWTLALANPRRPVHASHATVALDLQSLVLLRLSDAGRTQRWVWLEQRAMPERWRDLRRAVHARPAVAATAAETWRPTAPADAP